MLPSHVERFETFWGQFMSGLSREAVAATIMSSGYHEEGLTRMMLALVGRGATVVDVGAHIGYFTLLAERLVGSTGRVFSLEPTPDTCALLLENVSSFPNVIVCRCAAWNESTTLRLRDFGRSRSAFNSFTAPRRPIVARREIEVAAVPLDAELDRRGLRPDFIKVDVESTERQVLEGLADTLQKTRPVLSIEVGDAGVPGVWTTVEMIEFMDTRHDYKAFEWQGRSFVPVRPRERWPYDNLLFAPRERRIG
jgi:FkbM family methyltransferase